MENSEELKQFIKEKSSLFWYIPENKKENIDEEVVVEFILNYGQIEDIKKMFSIIGIQRVAFIFNNLKDRQKLNYYPEIFNYFSLYLKKHA
ncbi:MAG: hypothetical protein A2033_16355 [Bacteroidetes bacterium GWA2_31_9]|nr:MAG: hypothetical protein A2033_16355 [Bacteroidetes bacterium GWA2_31_9]